MGDEASLSLDLADSQGIQSLRILRRQLARRGLPTHRTPQAEAELAAFCILRDFLALYEDFKRHLRRGEAVSLRALDQRPTPGRLTIEIRIEPQSPRKD